VKSTLTQLFFLTDKVQLVEKPASSPHCLFGVT